MRKPNKNKMAGVNSLFASVSESIFNGFLLQMLLRSLSVYILNNYSATIHLRAAEEKQNSFRRYIVTNIVALWAASYSAYVVCTKTIIHLSVGESGGYLPPLR